MCCNTNLLEQDCRDSLLKFDFDRDFDINGEVYIKNMAASVGQKVRYFRKNAKLSQLELENAINASAGSVSRLESGRVNPTKETLIQIARELNLNIMETDYLFGFTDEPASDDEINRARKEVADIMNDPFRLVYLVDDRNRVIDVGKTFLKLFEVPESMLDEIRGITLSEWAINPRYRFLEHLNEEDREFILYNYIRSFHVDSHFFIDDDQTNKNIEVLESSPITKRLWQKVLKEDLLVLLDISTRKVAFKFFGNRIELVYSNTVLGKYKRFQLIEYIPTEELKNLFDSIYR